MASGTVSILLQLKVPLFHIWGRKPSSIYRCSHTDASKKLKKLDKNPPPIATALHAGLLKLSLEEGCSSGQSPAVLVLSSHSSASCSPASLPRRAMLLHWDVVLSCDATPELQLTVSSLASFQTASAWTLQPGSLPLRGCSDGATVRENGGKKIKVSIKKNPPDIFANRLSKLQHWLYYGCQLLLASIRLSWAMWSEQHKAVSGRDNKNTPEQADSLFRAQFQRKGTDLQLIFLLRALNRWESYLM